MMPRNAPSEHSAGKNGRVPKISVIMSVFNGEPYVGEAIESVRSQTFTDFEFIIVDDGSTDSSLDRIRRSSLEDDRIRVVRNHSNRGLIYSLNKGFDLAVGEYIARHDADDVSHRERFEAQVRFLDLHPDVGVVGTWMTNLYRSGAKSTWKTPTADPLIRWSLLFCTSIAHATVMMRRSILDESPVFRPEKVHAEDYDLWSRISGKTRFGNLGRVLYWRRCLPGGVCVRFGEEQRQMGRRIMRANAERLLGRALDDELIYLIDRAHHGERLRDEGQLERVREFVVGLHSAFLKRHVLNAEQAAQIGSSAGEFLIRVGLKHLGWSPVSAMGVLGDGIRVSGGVPLRTFAEATVALWRAHRKGVGRAG